MKTTVYLSDEAKAALGREAARANTSEAEVGLLRDVEAGAYEVTGLSDMEMGQAISLIEQQYADRNLGIADAANVVLAARHRTTQLLTLDARDYRVVRPLWGDAFTLLPADA